MDFRYCIVVCGTSGWRRACAHNTTTAAASNVVNMNRLSGEGPSAAAGEKCLEVRTVNGAGNGGSAF